MGNREKRKEDVNRAVALSTLDAEAPSEFALELAAQYTEDKIDPEKMTARLVQYYKNI